MALTLPEVAERYGVGLKTVRAWVASGELRTVNVSRSPGSQKPRLRVTADALDRFELLRQSESPSKPTRRKRSRAGVPSYY